VYARQRVPRQVGLRLRRLELMAGAIGNGGGGLIGAAWLHPPSSHLPKVRLRPLPFAGGRVTGQRLCCSRRRCWGPDDQRADFGARICPAPVRIGICRRLPIATCIDNRPGGRRAQHPNL